MDSSTGRDPAVLSPVRVPSAVLCLAGLAHGWALPAAQAAAALETVLECRVGADQSGFSLDCRDGSKPPPGLAITLPGFLVGDIVPGGLLRELANPLGFGAGSDAFNEPTGFSLERCNLERPPGLLWLPMPGAVGLFTEPLWAGGAILGAFFSVAPGEGWGAVQSARAAWGADAALCLAEPPPARFGDSWFREDAPFPGGSLLLAAGRVRAALSWLSMGATLGCSFAQALRPGWFAHLRGSAKAGPVEVALLLGGCGGDYRAPSGATPGATWRVSGRAGLVSGESTAEVEYTVDIARPAFAPRAFLAERQRVSAGIERAFSIMEGLRAVIRVDADKRIETDTCGVNREEARCSGNIGLSSRKVQASVELSWSIESGASAGANVTFSPNEVVRLVVEAGCSAPDRAFLRLSWRIKEQAAPE